MKINKFKLSLLNILINSENPKISNITSEDTNYIIVTCTDNSIFSIQIQETAFCKYMLNNILQDNEADLEVKQYLSTHTREEFLNEMDNLHENYPKFYESLIVLMKILEMGIISLSTYESIMEKLRGKLLP